MLAPLMNKTHVCYIEVTANWWTSIEVNAWYQRTYSWISKLEYWSNITILVGISRLKKFCIPELLVWVNTILNTIMSWTIIFDTKAILFGYQSACMVYSWTQLIWKRKKWYQSNIGPYASKERFLQWFILKKAVYQKNIHKYILITIFVDLGLFRHFEIVINIWTWMKSHIYWRML